jgi:hypothetical protein
MTLSVDITGEQAVKDMLEQVQGRQLNNRMRRGLRAGAGVFRKAMRGRGGGNWPRRPKSFHKTRTRPHRIPLGVSVSPQSPLSTIYEHGARPHAIPIRTGPSAGHVVQHPGVAPRPFIAPIFDQAQAEAERAFIDKIAEGLEK